MRPISLRNLAVMIMFLVHVGLVATQNPITILYDSLA